jgi:DNA-binding transcriptional LysR family regulator
MPVSQDKLALIIWPGHEWCKREIVEPYELVGKYPFIHARPDSAMRSVVEKYIQQEGLIFGDVIEMANQESIKLSVEQRLGVSLISSIAIQHELKTGRLVEVPLRRLDSVARDFLLISRADQELNAIEKAFVELLHP